MTQNKPTAIDLFAGCGGFSLGLIKAGFNVIAAVEIDPWAAKTYTTNLGRCGVRVFQEDIRKISARRLLRECGVNKYSLDLLVGGPPCQGFSTMNSKRGLDDPRSMLMLEFIRMVRGIAPRYFIIENVPGLFAFKDFFMLLMGTLEKFGYAVRCLMMDSVSYGIPQFRKRIFIHGSRSGIPVFPKPTHFDPNVLAPSKESMFSRSEMAVRCFAENGFAKEEVEDLHWNNKLGIMMNRKKALKTFNAACGRIIAEAVKKTFRQPT